MKESFLFYLSHYEIIKDLKDEDLGKIFRAMCEYELGNEVELPPNLKMAFDFIVIQMDINNKKWERAKYKVLRSFILF